MDSKDQGGSRTGTRTGARDILAIAAVSCIGYGAWQIYPPAAWIAVGVVLGAIVIAGLILQGGGGGRA